MTLFIAYVGLSYLIALLGRRRKLGFWGYLFCSLFLTPCIGFLFLMASDARPKKQSV